jgi:hypothetical protein
VEVLIGLAIDARRTSGERGGDVVKKWCPELFYL